MIAAFITLLALGSMYPAARLLARSQHDPVLTWTATLALSTGMVSLTMLGTGLAGIPLDWRITAGITAAISLGAWFWWRRRGSSVTTMATTAPPLVPLEIAALVVIAIMVALILFNATFWPVAIDDAVAIYAYYGKQIYQTQQLPSGTLYETYPMLVPLWYAFIHQLSGQINEYLAGLIPALLAVGCIGSAYLIGRELYNRRTGVLAALLVSVAPPFAQWASTGYVDLPAGFFFAMAMFFLCRWERQNYAQDALLGGLMVGLAAWTKNNMLVLPLIVVVWLVYVTWRRSKMPVLSHLALIFAGIVVTAGGWYWRTFITAGLLIPPTAWTDQAQRTVWSLFPYLNFAQNSIIGVFFTLGLLGVLWRSVRSGWSQRSSTSLLIFYLPFFAAWWLLASYDSRFLLAMTPLIAVMAGRLLMQAWSWLPLRALIVVSVAVLTLQSAIAAVDHKTELLRNPFPSDLEKHRIRVGSRYDMAQFINALPAEPVWTSDLLLPYYLNTLDTFVAPLPAIPDQMNGYRYVVLRRQDDPLWLSSTEPLYEIGDYRLYSLPSR